MIAPTLAAGLAGLAGLAEAIPLRWAAVSVALVGPWVWLVVLDRLLRRKR